MNTATILGIGNYLLSDDGIGNFVVEELKKLNTFNQMNYVVGETDIDFCISQILTSNSIVIIDAIITGKEPGTITAFHLNKKITKRNWKLSMHSLHLFEVLNCLNLVKEIYIIGIEPYDIQIGYGLSPTLTKSFKDIVSDIQNYLYKIVEI